MLLLVSLPALGGRYLSVDRCGVFEMEGYLRKEKMAGDSISLHVNSGTDSEFDVFFGPYDAATHAKYVDTKVRVLAGVYRRCSYQCVGKLVKVEKRLDPWDVPGEFLDSKASLKEPVTCRN
jgi:hypothetical protein